MRIVNIMAAPPPYVYAGRFLPKIGEGGVGLYSKKKDNVQALRLYLWEKLKVDDEATIKALLDVRPDWILGCFCCSLEGQEIFTASEVCYGQVLFKAIKHLRWTKKLPSLEDLAKSA